MCPRKFSRKRGDSRHVTYPLSSNYNNNFTNDSKIIRALEIVLVKKLISNASSCKNIYQNIIFKLCIVDNNHEIIKFYNQIREKSQVLSQVLE